MKTSGSAERYSCFCACGANLRVIKKKEIAMRKDTKRKKLEVTVKMIVVVSLRAKMEALAKGGLECMK